MDRLEDLSREDRQAIERLEDRQSDMVDQTVSWAEINTGSFNTAGLKSFAPTLADAFSRLDANLLLEDAVPFETVDSSGDVTAVDTGPLLRLEARPDAPVQVVMSGHYDTVFPKDSAFQSITDLGDGRLNGPGLADMKGGLCLMLEALATFEAGPLKDRLGYKIVITPDEEIGNFASASALHEVASSGAQIGMTYEPCMENGAMSGARKGSAVFDVVMRGKASHAGRAHHEGRSAIAAAAEFVAALENLNGRREGVTFNTGKIEGGNAVNIVPDLAIVRFGARAPDADAAAWATAEVERLVAEATKRDGISAHRHGGFYRPPKPRNAAQQALFDAVEGTGKALGLALEFIDTGGVCEGNNIFAAGVPNVDTLGVHGGRIHSDEEYVIKESFSVRAALSALLLNRLVDGRIDAAAIKAKMR
ncbi:MAG: hydrolase [Pseudomonadota bacterium]